MNWYSKMLKQTATYWPPSVKDDFGNDSYGSPQSIPCRWEDVQEMFVNSKGEEKRSQANVFVNQDLLNGGYLYLGASATVDPRTVAGVFLIEKFEKIPSVNADMFERKAWL
jgi:hypothetical protein